MLGRVFLNYTPNPYFIILFPEGQRYYTGPYTSKEIYSSSSLIPMWHTAQFRMRIDFSVFPPFSIWDYFLSGTTVEANSKAFDINFPVR